MNIKANVNPKLFEEQLQVVDAHTNGEFCRVVISGFKEPEGETMIEKKNWMEQNYDHVRTALMHEPRGHRDMFGAFICEPINPEAHLGIIFMDTGGYLNMCGHCTIGAVTVAIEAELVPSKEGFNAVILDSPAGLIRTTALVDEGKVVNVTFTNVPSFVYLENLVAKVDERDIPYSIAFGGSFFAMVDTTKIGIDEINKEIVPELTDIGVKLRDEIKKDVVVAHPQMDINSVDLVEFYDPKSSNEKADMRNVVIFGESQADRSPCGTGTSAKLATLHKKGQLEVGEEFIYESFIGTTFKGVIKEETKVGNYDAIIPEITGSAYLTGYGTYLIDADDPLKYGFVVG